MEESKNNDKANPLNNIPGTVNNIPGVISNIPGQVDNLFKVTDIYSQLFSINSNTRGSISSYINVFPFTKLSTSERTFRELKHYQETNDLRSQLLKALEELASVKADKDSLSVDKEKELNHIIAKIESKEKINHIIPRICEEARQKLLSEDTFKNLFEDSQSCDSVVVSIDIRRSTELMLRARKPELFSKFITELSQKLSEVIISNYGVFDKFTGDGILAFFPKFYSGKHAIIRALKAAEECHKVFFEHYNNSRGCFNVFIKDTGLGIGVDYGNVTLVNTRNELTVVGIPVVYACRMSGAKAGDTLLNQPAIEEIERLCHHFIKISETEIDIKHEGKAIAYKVEIHENAFNIPKPFWPESDEVNNSENLELSLE